MEIKDIDQAIRRANKEYEENGCTLVFVTIQEVVLKSKNPGYMLKFVKNVPEACVERFGAAIKRTKNAEYISLFEKFVNEDNAESAI